MTRVKQSVFNPADFYERVEDTASSSYNPISNEMDAIYLGAPDPDDPSYSYPSLIATVIHELQHLKSFSVSMAQQEGRPSPVKEQLFIEEGLSHLAENLGGYGVSGGDAAFVWTYLSGTASVPLGPFEGIGGGDSVGRRGGMSLLLSFLVRAQGGIRFEGNVIVDEGGLSFLRRLYASKERGWDRLESATGMTREDIILSFSEFLMEDRVAVPVIDPITSEPIFLDPFYGEIQSLGRVFNFKGPLVVDFFKSVDVVPYALGFGERFTLESDDAISAFGESGLRLFFFRVQ